MDERYEITPFQLVTDVAGIITEDEHFQLIEIWSKVQAPVVTWDYYQMIYGPLSAEEM